jgi:hypothetical protein
MTSKIEYINEHFKLPIFYNKKKMELSKNITTDLELIETIHENNTHCQPSCDESTMSNLDTPVSDYEIPRGKNIYSYAFKPKTIFGEKIICQVSNYYTTDVKFLKDSQKLLKKYKSTLFTEGAEVVLPSLPKDSPSILELWNTIKNDNGFKERYQYIDWNSWEFLNKSEIFLQIMSIYNLMSPLLSLLIPVILLVIPFFVIKMKGLSISVHEYIEVLKVIASNHAIGKIFTCDFTNVNMNEKIYMLLSAFFYLFTIYQNILVCHRFHENMKKIHQSLNQFYKYIEYTEACMSNLLVYTQPLKSYNEFNISLNKNKDILTKLRIQIGKISPYKFSILKVSEFGKVLKCFYDIYENEDYNSSIMYSFGFHGYLDILEGIISNIKNKYISTCLLNNNNDTNKNIKNIFKNMYYPVLMHENPVKNDYNFNKNMIITGPNASGKTTILKSVLINVILTQQFGCGFYESAKFSPFKFIHCYLNIPDTSGRDSLFQSESRRCKDIIDIINSNNKDKHFCVFDELYSGTNPEEAILSASAFMNYLTNNKNVNCILTTHFIQVCKHLENNLQIVNYKMKVIQTSQTFTYSYKLDKGISTICGGIKILSDMNYPKEIIDSITSEKLVAIEKN